MRILFVTRKHPPSVGGMQRLSHQLITHMRRRARVSAITWGGSQKLLPLFLIYALGRGISIGGCGVDLVHVGDPIVSPIGWILKKIFRVPVVGTVHGLDVTYPNPVYQWLVPRLLRALDSVVCISHSTYRECLERGIPADICAIIPPGVTVPSVRLDRDTARQWLEEVVERDLQGVAVLLTVGRLVPRKGVAWFVESVWPRVLRGGGDVCYVVVGRGPDEERVRALMARPEVAGKSHMLGRVSEGDLARVYAAADLFVMANTRTPGDMEGFGLVALEAAAYGVPVLAADLEGIQDAVVSGKTGCLLQSGDADVWVEGVLKMLSDPTGLQKMSRLAYAAVQERFTWANMADAYHALFCELLEERRL